MKPAGPQSRPIWDGPHARIRTDGYMLLAAFLTGPPSRALVDLVRQMSWEEDLPERMRLILDSLNQAARQFPEESIVEEYELLFVGLGKGELVPYGSWYLEKMIQSAPLAAIRSDLNRLGIVRQEDCFESEDHAGALCEIMALLSAPENEVPDHEQAAFFASHIASWMPAFFKDMQEAEMVDFYRTVGTFGSCFLEMERVFLQGRPGA